MQKAGQIAINKKLGLVFYDHHGKRLDKKGHTHPVHLDYEYEWKK